MNNELFTIKPSLRQYYGRTITKETEFDEYTDDKTVHQTLKDLILTTEINKENEYDYVFGHGVIQEVMTMVKRKSTKNKRITTPIFTTKELSSICKGDVDYEVGEFISVFADQLRGFPGKGRESDPESRF